jgi:hypothetical protein
VPQLYRNSFEPSRILAEATRFTWSATYDALDRRLATTTVLVSNGVPSVVPPQVLNSYYDPQVEFLELGVLLSSAPQVEFLEAGTSPSVQ